MILDNFIRKLILCAVLVCCMPVMGQGRIIEVGPSKTYKKPSEAAKVAKDGDFIQIDAGVYSGDATVWRQNDLFIYGYGGFAHLMADGASAENKAIWVIKGDNIKVANVEFSGAKVKDRNGAGIRQEGTNLTVLGCYFHGNENGILTGKNPESEITIDRSEFAYNGAADGQSHNIYIGKIRRFTLKFCYVHHARVGHNVKSRAIENYILYNRLMDEVAGTSSYIIDLPNGGTAYIIGNVIQQGPQNQNYTLVSFAAEGEKNSSKGFYVVNNTFVNDHTAGNYIKNMSKTTSAKIINNLFFGPNKEVIIGLGENTDNLAFMRGGYLNFIAKEPEFINKSTFNYRLKSNSPAVNAGIDPGRANGFSLVPAWHYVHLCRKEERKIIDKIDLGAYESQNK